jgi:hypothetical protein
LEDPVEEEDLQLVMILLHGLLPEEQVAQVMVMVMFLHFMVVVQEAPAAEQLYYPLEHSH